jgi:hypothetical protein
VRPTFLIDLDALWRKRPLARDVLLARHTAFREAAGDAHSRGELGDTACSAAGRGGPATTSREP